MYYFPYKAPISLRPNGFGKKSPLPNTRLLSFPYVYLPDSKFALFPLSPVSQEIPVFFGSFLKLAHHLLLLWNAATIVWTEKRSVFCDENH